jgi:tRNA threonylcarbamoyladenosine modification (KEOPS) complex Cgi121 subunit
MHRVFYHAQRDVKSFTYNIGNVTPREAIGQFGKHAKVVPGECVCHVCQAVSEERQTARGLWQWNIDTLLQSSSHRGINEPRYVGGAKKGDATHTLANAIQLKEELCEKLARRLRRAVAVTAARLAERINLVDEDDGWSVIACRLK